MGLQLGRDDGEEGEEVVGSVEGMRDGWYDGRRVGFIDGV